jgi:hypothetical protein
VTLENGASNDTDEQPQPELADQLSDQLSDQDDKEEDFAIGDVPAAIFELAEACRRFVHSALGVELDFSAETLPLVDEYLRQARQSFVDRPETEPVVTSAVAAYYGEVIRSRIDGFWRRKSKDSQEWLLSARRAYLSMSPLGMVLDSLAEGKERPGPSAELDLAPDERAAVETRLSVFPPVSEDEYYLLSTRLEVIEVVYESLRDRMKAEGRESLVYDEQDYADE